MVKNKKCSSCEEEKPLSEYWKAYRNKDGLNGSCRDCITKYNNNLPEEKKEAQKLRYRIANLKRSFGITIEQYDELFEKQKGCCAVCQRHQDHFKTRLAVDHNHKTGEIRGLLCNNCNRRFIGRYTDGTLFEQAAVYLRQGTGLFVPENQRTTKRRRKKKET